MTFVLFYHSALSDWNHGNAHFLRGVATDLQSRGHDVRVFEPANAWSVENLVRDHGDSAIAAFHAAYPGLDSRRYKHLDLDEALAGVDAVLVHEWNEPALVARIGEHRARNRYTLLFHDTHHRMVTAPGEMARYEPFGLSIVEAALAGCALVIGDIPTLREIWGDTAMYVRPGDPDALAHALQTLIDDPVRRHELSTASRGRALALTPARMAEAYRGLYEELCSRPQEECA